jgi:hypothetical protein
VYYLAVDMRLQCYTREWFGYALYAGIMGALYVVGLPLSITIILVRRRRTLFGDGSDETRRVYGFLYDAYGPVAWWWEVEELLRKLFLTALVVLMDPGSPLQVTLAVLVSGWAHVLHAVYKPWRLSAKTLDNRTYMVQHASLLVTSFVFLMGLLFKVEGVSSSTPTYESLSVVMLLLCIAFVVWWCFEMFSQVATKACARARRHRGTVDGSRVGSVYGYGERAALKLTSGGGVSSSGGSDASRHGVNDGDRGAWSAVALTAAGVGGGDAETHGVGVGSGNGRVDADAKASGVGRRFTLTEPDAAVIDAVRDGDHVAVVRNPMHVRRGRDDDRDGVVATTSTATVTTRSDGGRAGVQPGGSTAGSDVGALSVYFHGRQGRGGGGTAGSHGGGASRDAETRSAASASRAARVESLGCSAGGDQ